jgi:bifunctional non-homologous end joining protein LigD
VLARATPGLRFNEHLDVEDGPLVFAHACKLGLEGIVSKRKDSRYISGRTPHWIKSKNPAAPAVTREGPTAAVICSCIATPADATTARS